MSAPVVWLASYPRSGNTFLRTVLYQCFGMRTGSIYPQDLMGQPGIEGLVGHVEHSPDGRIDFGDQKIRFIKTHSMPQDDRPAIYVVRDGREAVISLFHFWRESRALTDIVDGPDHFGSWADHVSAWSPEQRPNTLLLRYEDLVDNLGACIDTIAERFGIEPISRTLPSRDELAAIDGHWIRPVDAKRRPLDGPVLDRFWEVNGTVMQEFGYW